MRLKKKLISLLLSAILLLTGCTNYTIPTNANTAFQNFTLCLFQQEVSSNTLNLHYTLQEPAKYGITDVPITLGSYDFNETSTLASIENLEAALHSFSPSFLSKKNQLTYDILSHYFKTLKTEASFYLYKEPLSPITGIHTQLPVLLAEYQLKDKEDVETYLALLKTLPDYFSSLIRFEQQKASSGLFMHDDVVDSVIQQCDAFVSMGEENYLLSSFEERLSSIKSITTNEHSKYMKENQQVVTSFVLPAYVSLASSLKSLMGSGRNAGGLCYYEKGKEYYTHLVSMETGTSRTIPKLKELIQTQTATDFLDIQTVIKENPTILEETDMTTDTPDHILQTLKAKISQAFPTSANVKVSVKYVPTALEKYLSPAFYLIPTIDNFSENTIYINKGSSMTDIDLFTTLAHECYPGHLYQTTYFASTNPDPMRNLLDYQGYIEGWATYAEMCSYYLSSLSKPHATLLQKNNSLILGLYAAADIGIHYDGWTLEDTVNHFSSYGINDEETIEDIYKYILGDPANYLKYYVGYLEILELKKECINAKGNRFLQKDFHRELLEIGPAPFEVIEKYMIR